MLHTLLVLLASQPAPPVKIWLGSGPTLVVGAGERVYVQTSTDGNLVVLHARPDGRIEVLFPGNPASDPFVRAGTYEIRGPANGAAFVSTAPVGRGILVAALSPDPMWFDEFVHNNMWQVGLGAGWDPEALLTDIVQRMLGDGSFNYDVVTYTIGSPAAPTVAVVGYSPLDVCVQCAFLVDRPFRRHRHRAPAVAPTPPTPAAIAVYSVHRPGVAMEPVNAPTDPTPLGARPWSAAERPNAAMRSLLLSRRIHATRSSESPVQTVVVPVSPVVTAGLAPVTAPAPVPIVVPEPQRAVRPDARPAAARAGSATSAPSAAQGGLSTRGGVGLGAIHTAGWRH